MYRFFIIIVAGFFTFAHVQAQDLSEISGVPSYRVPEFSAEFQYASKYIEILGAKIHYIDEGEGDTFLFLHGNPTSSYLWRNVMRYVRPHGRIVALDNVGFGKSAKPDIDYTLQTHIQYTNAFVEALGLKDIILVVHDWGSVLGLNYAATQSANVKGIVMMEAFLPPAFPADSVDVFGAAGGFFTQLRDPKAGRELIIEKNIFIEQLLGNASLTRIMPADVVDVYRAPFTDPASREPIFVWPQEIPIGGIPARNVTIFNRYANWLKTAKTPKLLQYVAPGALVTPERADWVARNFPKIETQFVGYGTHFIQEDNPQAIGRGIVDWHRRNFN